MLTRRIGLPITLLLALGGCREAAAPVEQLDSSPHVSADNAWSSSAGLPTLRQSPAAPPLQAYQVSFVAANALGLNYRPRPGQSQGDPFLRFKIPINGLVAGANGVPLNRGDSVLITLTVDSVYFRVEFQPSGVLFSKSSPAQLAIWYQDANPDLNGDGVVNAVDDSLRQQLAIYTQNQATDPWKQLSSKNDTTQQYVASDVYHFSEYAVSW